MHTNHKAIALQQTRIKKHIASNDSYTFFNVLTGTDIFDALENLLPEHRERLFPPTETLSMFLAQVMSSDGSCQQIVNTTAVQRLVNGLPTCSTFTGSYCKARQRLPPAFISELVKFTGQHSEQLSPNHWSWQGRSVKLVDGTTVTMSDTTENQAVYPQQGGQAPGLGFPICRIVGVVSLATGSVINAAMGPFKGKGADERTLLRGLLDSFIAGDVMVGDAYYCSYFLLAELMARGVDAVFEQHGSRRQKTDFRQGQWVGEKDHLMTYPKPKQKPDWMSEDYYQAAPAEITIRELKVGDKLLVTTLLSPKDASKQSLKALYKDRWHVELDLRNIKTTMGMEVFRCKSPEMVEKEFWVYLLAYNLIRLVMAQSAILADILPRQISFKHSLQLWQAYRSQQQTKIDEEKVKILCLLVAENTVGHRPGRIEPRLIKRRPKPYKLLKVPRHEAREIVVKYGHSKKQK